MTVSKYEGQKQKTETLRNRFFTRSLTHQSPTFELAKEWNEHLGCFLNFHCTLRHDFGHGIYLWQAMAYKHCTSCSTSDCGPQNLRMKHLELAAAVNTQGEIKDLDLRFSWANFLLIALMSQKKSQN